MTKIIGCLQKVEPWDVNSKLEQIFSFQLHIIPHALVWLSCKFLQVIVFYFGVGREHLMHVLVCISNMLSLNPSF
jgi:hypothetical protein